MDPNDSEILPDDDYPRCELIKINLAVGKKRTIQHMMAMSLWSSDRIPISALKYIERNILLNLKGIFS